MYRPDPQQDAIYLATVQEEVAASKLRDEGYVDLPPEFNRAARRAVARGRPIRLSGRTALARHVREAS